jgi:CDP-glucose 4,6-dehydratase
VFDNVYRGSSVLVTGHTGFKGSWLAIWLKELGAEVIGYSLAPPSEPSNFQATGLDDRMTHVHGDIRDLDALMDTFATYTPEFVFHLAAQPIVRRSYGEPKTTFDTNVGGTVNVLEAARKTESVKVLVNVTSDKCYENREWAWGYRENDPLGGCDPYSASKGCAELAFNAYLKSFFAAPPADAGRGAPGVGAASVRAGNVIGGGDWGADRLVPDCIRALSSGRAIGIRNPGAVRPWQHVLEPLHGYLLLGAALRQHPETYSGAWNFGPDSDSALTVAAMADRLVACWGRGAWKDLSDSRAPHEARLLRLNCDKAYGELHWRSLLTVDECLRMTVDWYRAFYAGRRSKEMHRYCIEQIRQFEEKAMGRTSLQREPRPSRQAVRAAPRPVGRSGVRGRGPRPVAS